MLAASRANADPAGGVLRKESTITTETHRANEATHRFRSRAGALWWPFCHRRAGVWQSASQQAAESLHATRQNQGRWAVETLLHGAEHREVGQLWKDGVAMKGSAEVTTNARRSI